MTKTLEFYFDFGSPNAYLAHHAMKDVIHRTGAELIYRPVLLGGIFKATNNQAPMMAFANVKGKLEYDRVEFQRFIKKHGLVNFAFNTHFPVNTLLLMRAAMVAQRDGYLLDYLEAGLKAMWEDSQNMSDPEVFISVMNAAGFDGSSLAKDTQDSSIKSSLVDATQDAVARGVFGIPTFFVGEEMYFGKERLAQIEDELSE